MLYRGDCTHFQHTVTLHSKNLITNVMKHLQEKLLLGALLLTLAGAAPLAAGTGRTVSQPVDGITCATPPAQPVKKKEKTKKQKKGKSKKNKNNKQNGQTATSKQKAA